MKVYIVFKFDDKGMGAVGVYSSRELAEDKAALLEDYNCTCWVFETTLDEEIVDDL